MQQHGRFVVLSFGLSCFSLTEGGTVSAFWAPQIFCFCRAALTWLQVQSPQKRNDAFSIHTHETVRWSWLISPYHVLHSFWHIPWLSR
jgi:hypothetical protein